MFIIHWVSPKVELEKKLICSKVIPGKKHERLGRVRRGKQESQTGGGAVARLPLREMGESILSELPEKHAECYPKLSVQKSWAHLL